MDKALLAHLYHRLQRHPPAPEVSDLLVYAISGPDALEAALRGTSLPPAKPDAGPSPLPAGAYLTAITVEGFRGIGEPVTLDIPLGPGLILVLGRNGSAKSSFAEAAELALTGDNHRWKGRSKVWAEGWRNLHHGTTRVGVDVVMEGTKGITNVERVWEDGAELEQGRVTVNRKPSGPDLGTLHWAAPLDLMRPFLSHNELGSLLEEGPTKLYDALSMILGLGDITVLAKTLADARLARGNALTTVTTDLGRILQELEHLGDDERARRLLIALPVNAKKWDLDEASRVLEAAASPPAREGQAADLPAIVRAIAVLEAPSRELVEANVRALHEAAAEVALTRGTDAARARIAARVLRDAITLHRDHAQRDCPVCHRAGVLDEAWLATADQEANDLEEKASHAEKAYAKQRDALRAARLLIARPPDALLHADTAGIDATQVRAAWATWMTDPRSDDSNSLADHLSLTHEPLTVAVTAVRSAAVARQSELESAWLAVAGSLRLWLSRAREALGGARHITGLKAAELWVKEAEAELRAERFRPIESGVRRYWDTLKQRSSVVIDSIALQGSRTRRRLDIDVTIDGEAGAALAVMSQGELNCLALSLFLPRACLPESPFRFVVVDDPVQAMDPAKVDGLAHILSETAKSRQVLVFTHDDRLSESIRRLELPALIYAVSRQADSVVTVSELHDPVQQLLDDARAVALTDRLPVPAGRVVPALCRQALEAACVDAVTRRRLLRGDSHAEVTDLRLATRKLMPWLALALFDDAGRGGDVLASLNNKYGAYAANAVTWCQRGAHQIQHGDLMAAIGHADALAQQLERLG